VFDGNVYVGSRNGTISSLDATTGAAVDPDDVHQPARALGSAGVRF
jgi:outer membrane protein assembly factor BamB